MQKIPIKYAKIDDEDFDLVSKYNWTLTGAEGKPKYAMAYNGNGNAPIYMHRLIMDFPVGKQIDHINHDTLDNRKENLRVCDQSDNNMNCRKRKKTASKYKGVTFCKQTNKWRAQISYRNKTKNIGRFILETDAAEAYNSFAKDLEFSHLNKVDINE